MQMAYVKRFEQRDTPPRKAAHKTTKGTYSTFERDGQKFVQFVSYGQGRNPEKISQTFQLDRDGAHNLYTILKRTFGFE
jgi:hypothetical protein